MSLKVEFLPLITNNPVASLLKEELERNEVNITGLDWGKSAFGPSYAFKMKRRGIDIAHFYFVTPYVLIGGVIVSLLSAVRFVLGLLMLKLLGIKIFWTVNNIFDHERRLNKIDYIARACLVSCCKKIIVYCNDSKTQMVNTFGKRHHKKYRIIPQGHYITCYPNTVSKSEARQRLNIKSSDLVLLFFGLIKPFKGVDDLIRQYSKIKDKNTTLIIAGLCPDPIYQKLIQNEAAKDTRITLITKRVPENEVQRLFNASDIVVFPYKRLFTSAAILLAMSFKKPCIAPNLGCVGETLDDKGAFIYQAKDQSGLLESIHKAIKSRDNLEAMGQHNVAKVKKWSWDLIAQQTKALYSNRYR